ncbi:hypothetical protein [Leeia oryzae]|uniref:hypothetical protein n=1 Tax=Leeia oryzae TaxID=356662 RepID=UPI00037400A7|nr:hypothetical protein [Leeia oryzae]
MSPLLISGLIFLFALSGFLIMKKRAGKTIPSDGPPDAAPDMERIGWQGQLWRAGVMLAAVAALVYGFFFLMFRDQTGWIDKFQLIVMQEPTRYVTMPRVIAFVLLAVLVCVLLLRTLRKMLFPAGLGRGYLRAAVALSILGLGLQIGLIAVIFMDDMEAGNIATRITWKLDPQGYIHDQAMLALKKELTERPENYCLQLRLKDPISITANNIGLDGQGSSYAFSHPEAMVILNNRMPYICTETAKRDIAYRLASNFAFLSQFKTRCPTLSASRYCTETANNLLDYGTPTPPDWMASTHIKDENDPDKGILSVMALMPDNPGYMLSVMEDWDKEKPVEQLEEAIRNRQYSPQDNRAELFAFDCKTGTHRSIWVDVHPGKSYRWWEVYKGENLNTAPAEAAYAKNTVGDRMYFNACFT